MHFFSQERERPLPPPLTLQSVHCRVIFQGLLVDIGKKLGSKKEEIAGDLVTSMLSNDQRHLSSATTAFLELPEYWYIFITSTEIGDNSI